MSQDRPDKSDCDDATAKKPSKPPRWMMHLLFLIGAIVIPVSLAYVASELHMLWYLHATGSIRSDQSENYALAFRAILLSLGVMLIALSAWIFIWWKTMRRNGRS